MYGQTYGKISYQSTAQAIERGIDQPANIKYMSSFNSEFVKHSDKKFETTAQIVGVHREEDTYKKVRISLLLLTVIMQPIPPATVYKFYGVDAPESVAQEASKTKTVNFAADTKKSASQEETYEDALKVFYGVENPKNQAEKLGAPIPGYCGFNRRVQADNVFGMTYAEARRRAQESQGRIETEKGETLRSTAVFIPEYTK